MDTTTPEFLPTLSAGKHRTPAQGACFMEYASYLAGERWTDRPACTDAILAELARCVNDSVSDDARQRLIHDVHRVIGLRADERLSLRIALRAAATAIRWVSEDRQKSLAIGMRGMLLALARRGEASGPAIEYAEAALDDVPRAAARADEYFAKVGHRPMHLIEVGGTQAVRHAVEGILVASEPPAADARLAGMLRDAIAEAEAIVRGAATRAAEAPRAERDLAAV